MMAGGRVAVKALARRHGFTAWARAIVGASYRRNAWAMFGAFFDESGTDKGTPVCVVAGLVASCLRWERLEKEWTRVLDREGVQLFHMKHFAHGRGEFKGWDKVRRDRFSTSLVNIIKRHAQWRVWTAIIKQDYRPIFRRDPREELLYAIGALGCASQVRWLSVKAYKNRHVNYVFEKGGTGSHYAFDAFRELDDKDENAFYRMGTLATPPKAERVALQAADLHAWEVTKYFADQVKGTGRGIRKSFEELLKVGDGGGYLLAGGKLAAMVKHMRRRRATNDPAIDPIPIPIDRLDRRRRVQLIEGEWQSILDPKKPA